jgi:hypothetical protein
MQVPLPLAKLLRIVPGSRSRQRLRQASEAERALAVDPPAGNSHL